MLYITPCGCDGKTGEGLAAASRGALLHFGRGIKSGAAILVLTAGPRCIRARGSLHICGRAYRCHSLRNRQKPCARGHVELDQISERISSFVKSAGANYRKLRHAVNYGLKTSSFKPGETFPLLPSGLGCVLHSRLSVGALRKFWAWALSTRGRGYRARGRGRKRKRTDPDILKGVKTILQSDVEWNKIFEVCCPILSGIVKVPPPDVPTSTLYTNGMMTACTSHSFFWVFRKEKSAWFGLHQQTGSPWCLL